MKAFAQNYGKWLWLGSLIVLLMLAFMFNANGDYQESQCNHIEVNIDQPGNTPLLVTATDVLAWVNARKNLIGERIDKIELSDLEQAVRQQPQVASCEMQLDFRGTLSIDLQPHLPIARVLRDARPDEYVTEEGLFFPTSKHYAARVMLLTGDFFNNKTTLSDDKSANLLSFLNFVNGQAFWKAQFTQIAVDKDQHMEVVPLLGDHLISLGKPVDIPAKLKRLEIFYGSIYPVDGWDSFSEVSVAYAHQVVCK